MTTREPADKPLADEAETTPLKPIPVFIATWALAGLGAVIGSALGSGAGKPGLFGGGLVGGVLGVVAAVLVLTKLQWLLAEDRRGAMVGVTRSEERTSEL